MERYDRLMQEGRTRTTFYRHGQIITTLNVAQQRIDVSVICQDRHVWTSMSIDDFRRLLKKCHTLEEFFNEVAKDLYAEQPEMLDQILFAQKKNEGEPDGESK